MSGGRTISGPAPRRAPRAYDAGPGLAAGRGTRWALAGLGVACVALGALGVVVPGLPTTIFLIIAIWCFARSCPLLERVLVRNRLFAPFLRYIDRMEPIPTRTKGAAIATMWVFVAMATALIVVLDRVPAWVALPVLAAAALGTFAISRWDADLRRAARSS